MTSEFEECERCERDQPPELIESVEIDEQHDICSGCVEDIEYRINNYRWYDRFTDAHLEWALDELEKQDEILCSHGDSSAGEIVVHTNYVDSHVVSDYCDSFGFEIIAFGPQWQNECIIEDTWECVQENGDCFEIVLSYTQRSQEPIPEGAEFSLVDREWLDEGDKQFSAGSS